MATETAFKRWGVTSSWNPWNGQPMVGTAGRDAPMPAPMGVAQRPMISLSDDFRAPHLKIINRRHSVEFLASENGRDWQSLVADFDASGFQTNLLHGFQALRPSLAASGVGEARFTEFNYRAL